MFISGSTEIGMARLSLSDSDKQARDWFAETTKALGCKVHFDAMGNQFAVRPGKEDGKPTYAGSHLDTQPSVSEALQVSETLLMHSGWPL
jgi:acetylornithine deacetylase/succinyl-diaminopimelate desuccinylase-like protein